MDKDYSNNSDGARNPQGHRPRIRRAAAPIVRSADADHRSDNQDTDYRTRRSYNGPSRDQRSGQRPYKSQRPNQGRNSENGNEWNSDQRQRPYKPQRPYQGRNAENGQESDGERQQRYSQSSRPAPSRGSNRRGTHTKKKKKDPNRERVHPMPKVKTPPPAPKPYDGTTRLNKYIANAGICSRREADKLIAAGSVSVNGVVITEMGFQVHEGDVVNYGGETLHSERKRYFLLNKPKGFITTVDDPQERETVMMLIDGACKERIYPVGRLDRNTTGLLLFTNDGDLARHLTHPSSKVYKIYQVELDKPVTREDMKQMLEGIILEDGPIKVDDVQYVQAANDKRVVGVELHSGKNRIVRRIFEHLGYNVHKLDRVVFAGLTKKDLPRGHYRELSEQEVGFLMMV